uniref:Large ribosomal subunit protein mL53 n=1 Tax=Salmo trutta TaxID=8032 RepID=A0A674DMA6_SALTR
MAASGRSAVICPFESNVRSTREFLVVVGSEKASSTNMNCEVMTQVKHDQSEPLVDITFRKLMMKGDPQAKITAKK